MLHKNTSQSQSILGIARSPEWEKAKIITIEKARSASANIIGDIWNGSISLEEMFGAAVDAFHLEGVNIPQAEEKFFRSLFLLRLACPVQEIRGELFFEDDFMGGWFEKQVKDTWSFLKEQEKILIRQALDKEDQNLLDQILGIDPLHQGVTQATKDKVSNLH